MIMESGGETMAMGKCPSAQDIVTKSLDNIVGNLWQQRQESSGSSAGNQSPRNGEELSDTEDQPAETSEARSPSTAAPNREYEPEELEKDVQGGQIKVKDRRDLIKEDEPGNPPDQHVLDPRDMLRDPRALLAGLPPLQTLEAINRQTRDFINSPQQILANLRQVGSILPPPPGLTTPSARPPSQPATPNSQRSSPVHHSNGSSSGGGGGGGQNNWSFEEQFKQLYEIDDNPKRKEFLDELFSLMQKRGTPINRLPIMAKQVLDLYELYNLVLARGGLVEVINKKQWQEVIKGLGLPSSITSAAFTLRTQYTKYLYPYECYKRNLSNPNDLQTAIEGNKRENRRSSYGSFPELLPHPLQGLPSQISPMPLVTGHPGSGARPPHLNGGSASLQLPPTSRSPPGAPGQDPISALEMTRLALWKMYNQADLKMPVPVSLPNLPGLQSAAADLLQAHQDKALNLQIAERQKAVMEAAAKGAKRQNDANDNETTEGKDEVVITRRQASSPSPRDTESPRRIRTREEMEDILQGEEEILDGEDDEDGASSLSPPPSKRPHREGDDEVIRENGSPVKKVPKRTMESLNSLPGANIKIASRDDGRGDTSLVVSLEINGINYQGVLFAQSQAKLRSS